MPLNAAKNQALSLSQLTLTAPSQREPLSGILLKVPSFPVSIPLNGPLCEGAPAKRVGERLFLCMFF